MLFHEIFQSKCDGNTKIALEFGLFKENGGFMSRFGKKLSTFEFLNSLPIHLTFLAKEVSDVF